MVGKNGCENAGCARRAEESEIFFAANEYTMGREQCQKLGGWAAAITSHSTISYGDVIKNFKDTLNICAICLDDHGRGSAATRERAPLHVEKYFRKAEFGKGIFGKDKLERLSSRDGSRLPLSVTISA